MSGIIDAGSSGHVRQVVEWERGIVSQMVAAMPFLLTTITVVFVFLDKFVLALIWGLIALASAFISILAYHYHVKKLQAKIQELESKLIR